MVPHLGQSHRLFEPRQRHPVLAEFAVHIRTAFSGFFRALDKRIEEERVRIEIIRTETFRIRVCICKLDEFDAGCVFPGRR